ncbi:MAG TPA: ATP-binding protein [Mycobacteriales bacterium]|nr:ATP-binding protein [Mycobacteriales bacterium]
MELTLGLCLPRDALSVPVARHIAAQALQAAGFDASDVEAIGLALTEACTNVLRHSVDGDRYEVRARLDEQTLVLEVIDAGHGFDGTALGSMDSDGVDPSAESGRGVQLMRAMVDDVRFDYTPGRGSIVSMTKNLHASVGSAPLRLRPEEA